MSLRILSPKHVGSGRLKSFVKSSVCPENDSYRITASKYWAVVLCAGLFLGFQCPSLPALSDTSSKSNSATAAMRYIQKLKEIEEFAAQEETDKEMVTRLTEEEINSYLSLDVNSDNQSCLKNMRMAFKQDVMEGISSVDFDCLRDTSSKTLSAIILRLFSGTHVITARGTIVSGNGKGHIQLEQVRFDDSVLPNFLIEEAIAAVCGKQEPPFNPMRSSPLPYNIIKITIHPGYIMVYQ